MHPLILLAFFLLVMEPVPEGEKTLIALSFDAPNPSYSVTVDSINEVREEIFVLAKVTKKEGMVAQVITKIADSAAIPKTAKPIRYFVTGPLWSWFDDEKITVLEDERAYRELVFDATRIKCPEADAE